MQLTPEQQEEVRRAMAAGERRMTLPFGPQEKDVWRMIVEQELAGKDDNVAHVRKIITGAEQRGFFGDVRRAIIFSKRPLGDLAAEIGVDARLLSDFRAGDAELLPAVLDRLLEVLGLRLMQEIPR